MVMSVLLSVKGRETFRAHKYRRALTLRFGPFAESMWERALLAMDVNDNAGCLNQRGARTFFASKLDPTDDNSAWATDAPIPEG
jgi:hypothetical protein